MSDSSREKGIVKWWNDAKGYGFLEREDGSDVFVHHSFLQGSGFRTLAEREEVEFEVIAGAKGPYAAKVARLGLREPEDDTPEQLPPEVPYLALALIGNRVRLVSLTKDGTCTFLDTADRRYGILYVASSETLALQRAVEEFEELVNAPSAREADMQDFFERNPDFIVGEEYKQAHPHIALEVASASGPLIPDFILEPLDCGGFADLLELKLPSAQVFVLKKNRLRFSAAVIEAVAQAREYGAFFDEETNRRSIQNQLGFTAYRPKLFVILGRKSSVDPLGARRAADDLPGRVSLQTYDDILVRMKARVDRMKHGGASA